MPSSRWRALYVSYPWTLVAAAVAFLLLLAGDAVLAYRWLTTRNDVATLRLGMNDAERQRTDMALESEQNREKVMLELVRRQSQRDRELHLAIAVDSGLMFLERDGIVLRTMPVTIGAERTAVTGADTLLAQPFRGVHTVDKVLGATDPWTLPLSVFRGRGLPVPDDRSVRGALGRAGLVLDNGAVLYALPTNGPLADSSYVMPRSILLRIDDLRAIAPNILTGMPVYVYE